MVDLCSDVFRIMESEKSPVVHEFARRRRAGSVKVRSSRCRSPISLMMELGSADLVFLCFVCFWRE